MGGSLRISGVGVGAPHGGEPGDLYVHIRVKPDPRFDRHEDDLKVTTGVDVALASLGGAVEVPPIDGEPVKVKIPAGGQAGATFRVREKGMPKLHGRGRGDLLVAVRVDVPKELTARQRELLEELHQTFHPEHGHGHSHKGEKGEGGVFGRIFGKD